MKFRKFDGVDVGVVMIVVGFSVLVASLVIAGGDYNPQYEADRQFRTALNGEIFTGDEEKDQIEIERLMELPRSVEAFPTGELAKNNWLYVDPGLEYAIEFDWTDSFTVKGEVIFDRTVKEKKK